MISNNALQNLLENKKYYEIDSILKMILSNKKTPYQFVIHSRALSLINRNEDACSLIENALCIHRTDLSLRIRHAELAMGIRDWSVAIERWQYIIDSYNNFPLGVFWRQATAYLNNKDFKNAKDIALLISRKSDEDNQKTQDFISIIESEQAKKYQVTFIKNKNILEYYLDKIKDQPSLGKVDFLKKYNIKVWVNVVPTVLVTLLVKTGNKIKKYKKNIVKPDENKNFSNNNTSTLCGFDYIIDVSNGAEIGFLLNNEEHWSVEIKPRKILDVLRGKDNWLFLSNDTNKSTDQFTGKLLLTKETEKNWNEFSEILLTYQNKYKLLYVIANTKEKIYPENYPFEPSDVNITKQVENIFSNYNINYLNPIEHLKSANGTFYKTDTHWSDFGAYLTFINIMTNFGYENPLSGITFKETRAVGDLGSKVHPPESSFRKTVEKKHQNKSLLENLSFNNGLSSSGMIRILTNQIAPNKKTVLIFGESSMTAGSLKLYFSYSFKRVIIINLPGSLVDEIINKEKPDLIIMLNNERYLPSPGYFYKNFHDSPLSKKLSSLDKKEKDEIYNIIDEFNNEIFYKKLTIEALNIAK